MCGALSSLYVCPKYFSIKCEVLLTREALVPIHILENKEQRFFMTVPPSASQTHPAPLMEAPPPLSDIILGNLPQRSQHLPGGHRSAATTCSERICLPN